MDQFTDPETRAHAEYLLGNLTMEEADATEDAGDEGDPLPRRLVALPQRDRQLPGDAPRLEGAIPDRHGLRSASRSRTSPRRST